MTCRKSTSSCLVLTLQLIVWATSSAFCEQPSKLRAERLGSGDHVRTVTVGGLKRTYLAHIPRGHNPMKSAPVVLALHGAAMNGSMMVWFSGLNRKADDAGFIVVYPSGSGTGPFLTWNAGESWGRGKPDDVAFIARLLDDLGTVVRIDPKRVYACGMSNGGMMCYRLAAELSDRIAAIAPVAGTMAIEQHRPGRAVPVIHFHGSADRIVPVVAARGKAPILWFMGVEESVRTRVKLNGCTGKPKTETISRIGDEMKVTRTTYGGGKGGSEVVLVMIEGGGHTWPGQKPPVGFIGKSALNISANDLMWEFFKKHPMR